MENQKKFLEKIKDFVGSNWFWFGLIFLSALALRLCWLETIPPGAWPIESHQGLQALNALEKGEFPHYDLVRFDRQGLHLNLLGWALKTFGVTNSSLRFFGALWGALTVAGLFLLARKLNFSLLTAQLASLAMTFSFWHLFFSRLVFPTTLVPFFLIWTSLLFLHCFQKKHLGNFWRNSWLFFLFSIFSSLLIFTYSHQSRPDQFLPAKQETLFLWLLAPVWVFFFSLGFLLSLKEIFQGLKKVYQKSPVDHFFLSCGFLQIIFWAMLLPGWLSREEVPFLLKFGNALPAIFLFSALPFEYFVQLQKRISSSENLPLKKWREKTLKISLGGLIFVFLLTGFFQSYFFFFSWAKNPQTLSSFENHSFQMGKVLQNLTLKEQNFFITTPGAEINHSPAMETFRFAGWPKSKNFLFSGPTPEILRDLPCENSLYFFQEADPWLLQQFQKKCPSSKLSSTISPDGQYQFWVME